MQRQLDRLPLPVIIAVCIGAAIVVHAALFVLLGFRAGGDAPRYWDGARRVLAGEPLSDRQQIYFGYIYLLAAIRAFTDQAVVIHAVQIAGGLIATIACVRLGGYFGGAIAALTTGLLFVSFYDIHKWNFYRLTDGLFISSVAVACWLTVRARQASMIPALAAILIMATLRFNGIVFAGFLLGYLACLRTDRRQRLAIALAAVLVILLPSAAPVTPFHPAPTEGQAPVQTGTLSFLTDGEVIWDTVKIPMPPQTEVSGRTVPDLLQYVAAHPVDVARLYSLRLLHYVFAYNPRFSPRHVLVTTAHWVIIYALTACGWWIVRRRDPALSWLALLWVCQGALVVLTVGDFDGRYSLYAAPALLPFAGVALAEAVYWISDRLSLRAIA